MPSFQNVARSVLALLAIGFLAGRCSGPLTQGPGPTEQIRFLVFEIGRSGTRTLLAEGARVYPRSDVFGTFGLERLLETNSWHQELMVTREFSIGASIVPRESAEGFGLWMHRRSAWYEVWLTQGFSWKWFDREDGSVFRKRQGPGRVRASFASKNGKLELVSVEFLEDVMFRLDARSFWLFSEHRDTHAMLVRAGSVLNFAL